MCALNKHSLMATLTIDRPAKIKGIQEQEPRPQYFTVEELNTLVATPCERNVSTEEYFDIENVIILL